MNKKKIFLIVVVSLIIIAFLFTYILSNRNIPDNNNKNNPQKNYDILETSESDPEIIKEIFANAEIQTADSARNGYDKLLENNDKPFDIIITDMQMESDFEPKYAGEWFVEQIKILKNYINTQIVIISAAYNIDIIAKNLGVHYIRKGTARNFPESYGFLKRFE